MKLSERVDKIESALVTHLEESGSIRTDLAWLKKAFWTMAVALVGAVVSQYFTLGGNYHESISGKMSKLSNVVINGQGPTPRP